MPSGRTVSFALIALVLAGRPASAHHSIQGLFDLTKSITVAGAITKVEWTNPHSYIDVDAKDDKGKTQHWVFELPGSGMLQHAGLTSADRGLKPGEMVTIDAIAAKDGSAAAFVTRLRFADGRVFALASKDPQGR